ncbi:MAG: DUF1214 domain-containing protein [Steroidobacteraceae bacterium]
MEIHEVKNSAGLAPAAFALATMLASGVATADMAVLATADQQSVETRALKIVSLPEVKEQIEASTRAFASLPPASDPEARRALRPAVEELAFATALDAANSDSSRPKVVWAFTAPRTWLGHAVPGSRWGIDNPDNVYRLIPVDGNSKYEITVRLHSPGPIQYSFLVYDSFVGEDGRQAHLDTPVAGLRDRDIKVRSDGSFTITVDSTPPDGRDNHIQTNENARALLVRNTFTDWQRQVPLEVSIKRLGVPANAPLSDEEVAHFAAGLLKAATQTLIGFEKTGFAAPKAANVIGKPVTRGGGWGFAASGSFKIADDEALVVTLDPLGAKYVGFDLTNPWLVSLEHVRGSGSLNNQQAQSSQDGSITYIIAAKDPGVYNWVSTSGLHAGNILVRWQVVPESTTSADAAIRSVKVVKLSALNAALPADTRQVTAAERRRLIDQRAAAYAHRYATVPNVAQLASPGDH